MAEDFGRRLGVPSLTTRAMQDAYDRINELPRFSIFSYGTPESNVTAQAPTLGFNLAPASLSSVLWIKETGSGNTGWFPICYGNDCGGGPT